MNDRGSRLEGQGPTLAWLCVAGLLLWGCQTQEPREPIPQSELMGRWQVLALSGIDAEPGSQAYLEFSKPPRLTGSGGCNRFFGIYRYENQSLKIDSALGSTKMACAAATMAQEQHLFRLLPDAVYAELDGSELLLRNSDGDVLVRAERKDGTQP